MMLLGQKTPEKHLFCSYFKIFLRELCVLRGKAVFATESFTAGGRGGQASGFFLSPKFLYSRFTALRR